ncbi:MICOS complex subunit MIC27 [Condylostylus longicornis]|uniref:MICOS complex subunit MIC27 n=1 Tax=Condylostylus longicornis TaxID=2530218 RepID=UPI00244E274B|nr:MICOS complex subunit MIC27 [Condylostylus longicornis]XP_055377845.1 MICOS complex subunit MIC27 [Condylostylus longicornis]
MLRKVVISSVPLYISATAVKKSEEKPVPPKVEDEFAHYKCKPSDLPLYVPLHAKNKKSDEHHKLEEPGAIESGIRAVRLEIKSACNAVASQKQHFADYIETAKAHTKSTVDYLNQPENTMPRVGAIAVGGLAGLIFSLRGGFIKRVLYTGIGAGAIASICYPDEAAKYGDVALKEAAKGINIGYNFVFGIKPGDDVEPIKLPKFPTNLSEISDSISDLAKSAKDALFSSKK